jgi:riboflavin biosynthesis pyrimidine reductase
MQIVTLYERAQAKQAVLTPELQQLYGGDLCFATPFVGRPYVIGNFVQTIDGVVSFRIPGRSGAEEISGDNAEDRFSMGLLRSMADAVIFGSGSLHTAHGHLHIPEFIYPQAKELFAALREKLGKPPLPLSVILTASGNIDLDEPTFHTDGLTVVIITTEEGAFRLASKRADRLSGVAVRSTGESVAATPAAVLKILADEFQVSLLLHEGGPTVFGAFLSAQMIDELFLTLAPQVAGRRDQSPRPSLAGEALFLPETAPWFSLASVKQGSNHLLLRYASTSNPKA